MLQFCKNRLKIEQNCITLSLILVQNYMQNLNKILVSKLGNDQRAQVSLFSNHFLIDRLSSVAMSPAMLPILFIALADSSKKKVIGFT